METQNHLRKRTVASQQQQQQQQPQQPQHTRRNDEEDDDDDDDDDAPELASQQQQKQQHTRRNDEEDEDDEDDAPELAGATSIITLSIVILIITSILLYFPNMFGVFDDNNDYYYNSHSMQHQEHPQRNYNYGDSHSIAYFNLSTLYHSAVINVPISRQSICNKCQGQGGFNERTCPTCRGAGQQMYVQQTMMGIQRFARTCERCNGRGKTYDKQCNICHGHGTHEEHTTLNIKLSPGLRSGDYIRIPNQGDALPNAQHHHDHVGSRLALKSKARIERLPASHIMCA